MQVYEGTDQVKLYQLTVWAQGIKLEMKGMKRHGPSMYSIVKKQLGLKGSRESVLNQLLAKIVEERKRLGYEVAEQ